MISEDYASIFINNSMRGTEAAKDSLLLPDWTKQDWEKFLSLTTTRAVRTGEFVINRNASDRTLYLVASGEYEVGTMRVGGATMRSIAYITAGSVIGDQSFFDGQPRSANVWAASAGVLLLLEYSSYQQYARAEPGLAVDFVFALGRVLSMRLRTTTLRATG
jgi:CRP/FNR family transcriptional regulator, cyclic AMP receptor protein